MDPVRDKWGEIAKSPITDKKGEVLKDRNNNKLFIRIIRTLDPVKKNALKVEYKSNNKYMNKKKNRHIEYKKQLVEV